MKLGSLYWLLHAVGMNLYLEESRYLFHDYEKMYSATAWLLFIKDRLI